MVYAYNNLIDKITSSTDSQTELAERIGLFDFYFIRLFSISQLEEIAEGICSGLTVEQIRIFADQDYSKSKMLELRTALILGVDDDKVRELSHQTVKDIRRNKMQIMLDSGIISMHHQQQRKYTRWEYCRYEKLAELIPKYNNVDKYLIKEILYIFGTQKAEYMIKFLNDNIENIPEDMLSILRSEEFLSIREYFSYRVFRCIMKGRSVEDIRFIMSKVNDEFFDLIYMAFMHGMDMNDVLTYYESNISSSGLYLSLLVAIKNRNYGMILRDVFTNNPILYKYESCDEEKIARFLSLKPSIKSIINLLNSRNFYSTIKDIFNDTHGLKKDDKVKKMEIYLNDLSNDRYTSYRLKEVELGRNSGIPESIIDEYRYMRHVYAMRVYRLMIQCGIEPEDRSRVIKSGFFTSDNFSRDFEDMMKFLFNLDIPMLMLFRCLKRISDIDISPYNYHQYTASVVKVINDFVLELNRSFDEFKKECGLKFSDRILKEVHIFVESGLTVQDAIDCGIEDLSNSEIEIRDFHNRRDGLLSKY